MVFPDPVERWRIYSRSFTSSKTTLDLRLYFQEPVLSLSLNVRYEGFVQLVSTHLDSVKRGSFLTSTTYGFCLASTTHKSVMF
jgi:hypothetical protein